MDIIKKIEEFENLDQMRHDEEWKVVWEIILSNAHLSGANLELFNAEQRQFEYYNKWLDICSSMMNDGYEFYYRNSPG
jgi:hypothetical protein